MILFKVVLLSIIIILFKIMINIKN